LVKPEKRHWLNSMDNKSRNLIDQAAFTPEETALMMRLRIFVNLRWLAVFAIVATTALASNVFGIEFPTLPVYLVCLFIALYNVVFFFQTRSLVSEKPGLVIRRANIYSNINIIVDIVTLTLLLHFSGGVENPFIFLFPIHAIAAGVVLPRRRTYILASFALFMAAMLLALEYFSVIPHVNLAGFVLPTRYQQFSRVIGTFAALTALVYGSTYLTTTIAGELKRKQREIVKLQGELITKKEIELELTSQEVVKLGEDKRRFIKFLGVAAHDLQAPLVATRSCLWVVLNSETGNLTGEQRDLLERSDRRINGLMELITDLLDIPRIETGKLITEMKPIPLSKAIRQAVDDMVSLANEKGIKIQFHLPETRLIVCGSGVRLVQVFTNLVSNAIKYSKEGTITLTVTENGADIIIEIKDEGHGISAEDLPHIFDDFFRAKNAQAKGTGLGLSITKRIIEAHGGQITATSPAEEGGWGTKFTVVLPRAKGCQYEENDDEF
jgi:signal transduction histidine kinase